MAAPTEDVSCVPEPKDEMLCTIEATVVTGFEPVAAEEAEERFKTKCKILRGRISIPCPIEKVVTISMKSRLTVFLSVTMNITHTFSPVNVDIVQTSVLVSHGLTVFIIIHSSESEEEDADHNHHFKRKKTCDESYVDSEGTTLPPSDNETLPPPLKLYVDFDSDVTTLPPSDNETLPPSDKSFLLTDTTSRSVPMFLVQIRCFTIDLIKDIGSEIIRPPPLICGEQVTDLGCVDNCRIVMKHIKDFNFTQDQNDNLQRLRNLVGSVDWPAGLNIWRKFFSFEHGVADYPAEITTDFGEVIIPPPRQVTEGEKKSKRSRKRNKKKKKFENKSDEKDVKQTDEGSKSVDSEIGDTERIDNDKVTEEQQEKENNAKSEGVSQAETDMSSNKHSKSDERLETSKEEEKESTETVTKKPRVRENPWNPMMPSFRVTCYRVGDKHNFDSMTAAANFGGAIYRYFGWNVKMTEFDIEVILGIDDQEVTVSLGLTKESLHRRNITHFGPTTLRPTIAYGMLRLCDIQTGDIVCDPMCGTGSIPLQGALRWPYSLNLAGEIGKRALQRCHSNIHDTDEKRKTENKSPLLIDAVRWDVCNLPVRDHSVDVFVTDLPFGVRMGHKVNNWTLYPGALFEMARVVKPETGRCCLLTEDKKCMIKTLQHIGKYWKRTKTLGVNIGGLAGGIYVLMRTAEPFDKHVNRDIFASKEKKGDKSMVTDSPDCCGDDI
ncbi:tRNA (guanine(6)-N2)-methyltransferase THUMP3-like [Mercenaria mercenaria]|uniref:tRNA (guanine(6)-N2)-methyltransferase THUMP3-like n=1 Tax=Mercenaria mercenaria TaxID=6596 RepID=UPI00234E9594|nr:tRNA (guanine(6)-N2)-methyltransferase THUMP3-like [Mercenaria mercenaria]